MIIKQSNDYIYYPGIESITDPRLTLEANKAGTLQFTVLPSHNLYNSLNKLRNNISVLDEEGSVLWKGRIISSTLDFYKNNEIVCEGKLASLNDSLYRANEFSGTPEELFEAILTNHNSQVTNDQKLLKGTVTVEDPNDYISRSWENATSSWELMKTRLLDTLGGYLVVRYESDGDYLDYLDEEDFVLSSNQKIVFGENLLDLSELISGDETYTACIPLGAEITEKTYGQVEYTLENPPTWEVNKYYTKSGEDYILVETEAEFNVYVASLTDLYEVTAEEKTGERVDIKSVNEGRDYIINTNAQSNYGTIYAPQSETTWDDITVPANLLSRAQDWLLNQGILLSTEIDVSFADLSKLGVNVDDIRVLDLVVINSIVHGFNNVQYLVKKIDLNIDDPGSSKLSVGTTTLSLTDKTIGANKNTSSGEQGPPGPPGADGQDGEDGKSAYEAAVEGGYTDPEATFNNDLADIGNKTTYSYVTEKISESAASVIDTAEEYTRTLINTCTSSTEFATYQQTVQNQFSQTIDGFNFNFNTLSQQLSVVGNKVTTQESYIRLENGVIIIGKADSPVTARFTNSALEFLYNGTKVAEFTNEKLWVKNIQTDNQIAFGAEWAIRPGNYISNVGSNLDIMWIGGNS